MMHKITTPVKGFSGDVGGLQFTNGHAETDDPNLVSYFRRHGYTVEDGQGKQDEVGDEKTLDDMKVDELKAYADGHNIDLGEATKKADILAVIQAASQEPSDQGDGQPGDQS